MESRQVFFTGVPVAPGQDMVWVHAGSQDAVFSVGKSALQSLFTQQRVDGRVRLSGSCSRKAAAAAAVASVLPQKKAYQIEILLGTMKQDGVRGLLQALRRLDPSVVPENLVREALKLLPSEDEVRLVESSVRNAALYCEDDAVSSLAPADGYVYAISRLPSLKTRFIALRFMNAYAENVESVRELMATVERACAEARACIPLHRVLTQALRFANRLALQGKWPRYRRDGSVPDLSKLLARALLLKDVHPILETRTFLSEGARLIHVIVAINDDPELMPTCSTLPNLGSMRRFTFDRLHSDLAELREGAEALSRIVEEGTTDAPGNSGEGGDPDGLQAYNGKAEIEIADLTSRIRHVEHEFCSLLEFYAQPVPTGALLRRQEPADFFGHLWTIVARFGAAKQETSAVEACMRVMKAG